MIVVHKHPIYGCVAFMTLINKTPCIAFKKKINGKI